MIELEKRILARRRIDEKDCWNWDGGHLPSGYGIYRFEGYTYRVHRLAMTLWRDFSYSSPLYVLHKKECNNRKCFNPDHLYIGTQYNNMHDMIELGNHRYPTKLTKEQVEEIRSSKKKCVELAATYGVDGSTISKVRLGRRWH